jgi:hypothetical protein
MADRRCVDISEVPATVRNEGGGRRLRRIDRAAPDCRGAWAEEAKVHASRSNRLRLTEDLVAACVQAILDDALFTVLGG